MSISSRSGSSSIVVVVVFVVVVAVVVRMTTFVNKVRTTVCFVFCCDGDDTRGARNNCRGRRRGPPIKQPTAGGRS